MPKLTAPKDIPALKVGQVNISRFRGVDLSNSPSNVDETRSPDALNMIPDMAGKPVKRTGYHRVGTYPAVIHAVHYLDLPGETRMVVHAGDKLYIGEEQVYSGMAEGRSVACQMDGKLWIADGKRLVCYGELDGTFQAKAVDEMAAVPMVVIGRRPTGGGTSFDPLNLLGDKWTDSFLGSETDKEYQLSFGDLSSAAVTAQILQKDGTWAERTEGTHFSVDRKTGKVTFTTAPGASPVTGADNVRITAAKDRSEYRARINQCDAAILFGVNGASDRLFLTGNPDYPNYDWFSGLGDPTMFGDLSYSVLGQDSSRIMGYTIIGDRLAAHKDAAENGRNIVLRQGILTDGKAAFPISGTLQGEGAVAKGAFGYLYNEPLYLTRLGVFAVTAQDVTGERYSQNRSFYVNRRLTAEPDLKNAIACGWKDFYVLAVGGHVYILDGSQRTYEKGEPYSTFQYECFYWDGIDATAIWSRDDTLYFGRQDGQILAFYTDFEDQMSFNDDGAPIRAYWEFPDFDGKDFYRNKTVRYLAFRLASAVATGVNVWAQVRGAWKLLYGEFARARYFAFSQATFSKWTFSTDPTPKTLGRKIKIKKVDKTRFRLENAELGEPFGLYEMSIEYTENGRYKR